MTVTKEVVLIDIPNLGQIGQVSDPKPKQIPPNAWTTLSNIRCQNGQIKSFAGHGDFTTPSVVPYYLLPVASGANYYWIYCGLAKVYIFDGSTHTDITRAAGDYTGLSTNRWNGCLINGYPVLNNGVDVPQVLNPVSAATDLVAITGWDSNWKAKVIRTYKSFLVALNVEKSGDSFPHMVKWSASDTLGSVPIDWDESSTSNDAGETSLGETSGFLVDGVALRDTFILYKEDSAYGMQYIGGQNTFRFYRISGLIGALAQDCAVEYPGGHFVVGDGDVYVHDGQNSRSIIDKKNKQFLFDAIDADNYQNTFVTLSRGKSEIWICYPESGNTFCNKVLIWNYEDNTWAARDLPDKTTFMSPGILTSQALTWGTLPYATWDDWSGTTWGARSYSPVADSLVGATENTKIYQFEDGNQFDGVNALCYAERTDLNLGGMTEAHTVNAIYPNAEGDSFDIYVGSQELANSAIFWEGPYSFNPSTDKKIDCRVTGLLHAIKFESEADVNWSVGSYEVDYKFSGRR